MNSLKSAQHFMFALKSYRIFKLCPLFLAPGIHTKLYQKLIIRVPIET